MERHYVISRTSTSNSPSSLSTMLSRTVIAFRAQRQLARHVPSISRRAPLSITTVRWKDEDVRSGIKYSNGSSHLRIRLRNGIRMYAILRVITDCRLNRMLLKILDREEL